MLTKRGTDRLWRWLAVGLALLLALAAFTACGGGDEEEQAAQEQDDAADSPVITTTATPSALPSATPLALPQLEVTQAVAYYFPSEKALYAAIEYENVGTGPAYVESVALAFNTGNRAVEAEFTPMLNSDDYVAAGQKATLAYWRSYEREEDLTVESPIAVESVAITAAAWDSSRADRKLLVENCTVIQNYPAFATLTGTISNEMGETDYALSLIYGSFYDENGGLIGVWHFTKNMTIRAESKRNFSVHLNALPIPDLEERTAEVVGRGVGIE